MDRLADYEKEKFEEEFADQNWYKGKQTKDIEAMEKARKRGKLSEWLPSRRRRRRRELNEKSSPRIKRNFSRTSRRLYSNINRNHPTRTAYKSSTSSRLGSIGSCRS